MRIAVLSDIHGVLPALEAVLAEPDVRSADRVVLTGDLAAGPQPVETLDMLLALGDRAVWVRGNADRELVTVRRGGQTSIPDSVAPWAASQLRPDQVELLDALPLSVVIDLDGAHWALLGRGGAVTMRRTHFDIDAACARIAAESAYPEAREFADYFVRSKASDVDALRVFGPRDGR